MTSGPQYLSATGNPLYNVNGPSFQCCCDTSLPDCNSCNPPLDWTYTVSVDFSAASDDRYDVATGDWDVDWTSDCTWYGRHSGTYYDVDLERYITRYWDITLSLQTVAAPSYWRVVFRFCSSSWAPISCQISWKLDLPGSPSGDPCTDDPPGSYTWLSSDGLCAGDADQSGVVSCDVA